MLHFQINNFHNSGDPGLLIKNEKNCDYEHSDFEFFYFKLNDPNVYGQNSIHISNKSAKAEHTWKLSKNLLVEDIYFFQKVVEFWR